MLRWEEKEDIVERFAEVDAAVAEWRECQAQVSDNLRDEFASRLMISWIFHDSALEGAVLAYSEIKAATDRNIISDVSLIPAYEDIKAFDRAARFALEYAAGKKPINLDFVRAIYDQLAPGDQEGYRKDNPLHRLYYHDIAAPEKVVALIRKFGDSLESPAFKDLHPVEAAAHAHLQLMGIFPWRSASGKVTRILVNALLLRRDYPLAVIHSIDRQRYYEALRGEDNKMVSLYLESVETTARSAVKVYEEAKARQARRNRRAS